MHYLEGKLFSGGISPATHRFIGMWRPPFDEVLKGKHPPADRKLVSLIPSPTQARKDWTAGFYDIPIYERFCSP